MVQGETRGLAAAELKPTRDRRLVDSQRHGGRQDEHVGASEGGHPAIDSTEQGMDQSVFETWDILQGQLHFSFNAPRTP